MATGLLGAPVRVEVRMTERYSEAEASVVADTVGVYDVNKVGVAIMQPEVRGVISVEVARRVEACGGGVGS